MGKILGKTEFWRANFLGMACYFAINELISVTAAQPNFQVYLEVYLSYR